MLHRASMGLLKDVNHLGGRTRAFHVEDSIKANVDAMIEQLLSCFEDVELGVIHVDFDALGLGADDVRCGSSLAANGMMNGVRRRRVRRRRKI